MSCTHPCVSLIQKNERLEPGRSGAGISTISIYNCALDERLLQSASAGVIFSITDKYPPSPPPSCSLLSLLSSFKKISMSQPRRSSAPFHLSALSMAADIGMRSASRGVCPEDVRRRGKVKHLVARRGLHVHSVLNSTEPAPCSRLSNVCRWRSAG